MTSPVTATELVTLVERQLAEGAWLYGVLVDARAMWEAPPQSDLRCFVSRIGELVAANGPRGPIAFVARHSAAIGSAQMLMFLGGKTDSLEVFWDMPEATQWLDAQMARPR
jgi:hypothetical protein